MAEAATAEPTAGEARKAVQAGELPIGTVEQILKRAPSDIVEEVVPIPEWECSVKLRSFTASASARIKSRGFGYRGENFQVAWGEMEVAQFMEGVKDPEFTENQVRELHSTSGRGFQRVIDWLDKQSGVDKEELRKAREEFQDESERDSD